ncbi:jg16472 [Pararge aegeria aegeria]|uniref:Jg16472 protein n=1 Tax=Pararge aegeria aegeria TaxID=348720 RepID=A0A8S4RKW0_9NEOP|nr:jg16472 [Pararge aegeria aegeria]
MSHPHKVEKVDNEALLPLVRHNCHQCLGTIQKGKHSERKTSEEYYEVAEELSLPILYVDIKVTRKIKGEDPVPTVDKTLQYLLKDPGHVYKYYPLLTEVDYGLLMLEGDLCPVVGREWVDIDDDDDDNRPCLGIG